MTNVLVVNKSGIVEEHQCDLDKLYTVCDYKSNKEFDLIYSYDIFEIYGKIKGKPENENKYIFPNVNQALYGNICIIKKDNDITINEWNSFYNTYVNDAELTFEDYESE